MCGIGGFSICTKDHRKIDSRILAKELLIRLQDRGRDATGAVWSEQNGAERELFYAKAPVPATEFVRHSLEQVPRYTRTALLHTRYATLGDPDNNDNNHPIVVPRVVGVHNGHIQNHKDIFRLLGVERIAEVDSEAIFQLIAANDDPLDDLSLLKGNAAIAWYTTDEPTVMHLARLKGSPLWTGTTENGSFMFASTRPILMGAAHAAKVTLDAVDEVPEWTYMQVQNGTIVDYRSLKDADAVLQDSLDYWVEYFRAR